MNDHIVKPITVIKCFQFEDHCATLEANIATVQQRISNEDDTWMDDDQDPDDIHRNVCSWNINFAL